MYNKCIGDKNMSEIDKQLLREFNRYGIENRDKVVNDKDYQEICKIVIKAMFKREQMPINDYLMVKEYMS